MDATEAGPAAVTPSLPPRRPGRWRQRWRRLHKLWHSHRLSWPLRSAWALGRWRLGLGPRPVRMLLCSDEKIYTSEQQWAPIWRWAGALGRRHGLLLCHRRIDPAAVGRLGGTEPVRPDRPEAGLPDGARDRAALRARTARGQPVG